MDFFNKYLKYKNKYLQLKNQLSQSGGAYCPVKGFQQHEGECWHDSTITVLLFCNGISEKMQELFDSGEFNVKKCLGIARDRVRIFEFLLPLNININPEELAKMFEYAGEYLDNLYRRYLNIKLPIRRANPEDEGEVIDRVVSAETSITCSINSLSIANMNYLRSREITREKGGHGGKIGDSLITISIFNFFLMNYSEIYRDEPPKYIYGNVVDLYHIFYTNNMEYMKTGLGKMRENIRKCKAVLLTTNNHQMAFIKCGEDNREFFYDDNGVNNDIKNLNKQTFFAPFEWVKYLNNQIDKILLIIEKIKSTPPENPFFHVLLQKYRTNPFKLHELFSSFLTGYKDIDLIKSDKSFSVSEKEINIGKSDYASKKSYIVKLTFIDVDTREIDYYNKIKDNYFYYYYNTPRLTSAIIESLESYDLFQLYKLFVNSFNLNNIEVVSAIIKLPYSDKIEYLLFKYNLLHSIFHYDELDDKDNDMLGITNAKLDIITTHVIKLINSDERLIKLNTTLDHKERIPIELLLKNRILNKEYQKSPIYDYNEELNKRYYKMLYDVLPEGIIRSKQIVSPDELDDLIEKTK